MAFTIFASCALLLVACGKTDTTSNMNANKAGADNASKTSTSGSPASNTTASTGEKIGVPECDEYLTKYEACVSAKVPDAARAQYKSSLEQTRKSWREMAANPQTKAGLAKACQLATDQAKQTFKLFGCDF
jgi:uncharacterized protein YaiL (DUF2058 family)